MIPAENAPPLTAEILSRAPFFPGRLPSRVFSYLSEKLPKISHYFRQLVPRKNAVVSCKIPGKDLYFILYRYALHSKK